jgi:hypothetical protein
VKVIKYTGLLITLMLMMAADKALAYRDGWTAENMMQMTDSCVSDIMDPLRQGFQQKVLQKGNTTTEFPEEKLKPSITDFCACITFRAANAHDYQKVMSDHTWDMQHDFENGNTRVTSVPRSIFSQVPVFFPASLFTSCVWRLRTYPVLLAMTDIGLFRVPKKFIIVKKTGIIPRYNQRGPTNGMEGIVNRVHGCFYRRTWR